VIGIVPARAPTQLERDGEKVVGEFLERLRAEVAKVFHDVPA